MGEFSLWHWLIVLAVVILLFGSARLPGAARSLGRSLRIFKSETRDLMTDDDDGPAASRQESREGPGASARELREGPGASARELREEAARLREEAARLEHQAGGRPQDHAAGDGDAAHGGYRGPDHG